MDHGPILIVDDDINIRESLSDALREEGYVVATAENGSDALQWLEGNPSPCLILLDLWMPVMNGEQFRRAQLADAARASIPVVVMSASPTASTEAKAMGACACLPKPVRLAKVVETIEQHC